MSRKRKKVEARTALGELDALLADARAQNTYASAESVRSAAESQDPDDLWRDYRQRPDVYNVLLARIAGTGTPADRSGRGELPPEVE